MITHLVLLKPNDTATPEQLDRLGAGGHALAKTIDGITSTKFGRDTSPAKADQGYTHALVVEFTDAAARDAYLPHPDHLAYSDTLMPLVSGVLVIDIETD